MSVNATANPLAGIPSSFFASSFGGSVSADQQQSDTQSFLADLRAKSAQSRALSSPLAGGSLIQMLMMLIMQMLSSITSGQGNTTASAAAGDDQKNEKSENGSSASAKPADSIAHTDGGSVETTPTMEKLAQAGKAVAGPKSQGLCATGVSKAISQAMGIQVHGDGKDFKDTLPASGKFKQVDISLQEALKTPGLILCWQKGSGEAGAKYGHVAITQGDGKTSTSDFVDSHTATASYSGLTVWAPV